jgi:hypothetical protein
MANDVFDIATDLSIRYYNTSISSYVEIVADSFEVDIDRGIDVENGVFTKGSVGTATVKMVKSNLNDFLGTPGYKANDYLEIRYKSRPDSAPTLWTELFTGYIQNVSMNYINESGTLQIELTVNDVMKSFLNTQIPSFSITGTTTQRNFRNCMINLAAAINTNLTFPSIFPGKIDFVPAGAGNSSTVQAAFTWLNTSSGEILNRVLDAELGWIWSAYRPNKVQYLARTDVASLRAITYNPASPTVSNVHYTNLIDNGNFDVNTTGWAGGTGVTLTRDTSTFYMSPACMRVNRAVGSATYTLATNTTMNASVGDKLKASIWAKALNASSGQARVVLNFYNSLGNTVGPAITGVYSTLSLTDWKELQVTAVMPATAVRADLRVDGLFASSSVTSGSYVDNAKLQNLTNISTSHYCLDNITLRYDSDLLVNKVKVTETNSGTTATATNTASVTANGEQSGTYSVTYDAAGSPTTLANLATRISNSATIKQVSSITTPAVRDDGTLSFVLDYDIAYTIQVEFAQDPLPPLQVVSLISRIRHNITPEYWSMNIDLWRGI